MWEIAIEARLGRVSFAFEPEQILVAALSDGWEELPVKAADALRARHLPDHHGDPFDRSLIVRVIAADAVPLTSDAALAPRSPIVRPV